MLHKFICHPCIGAMLFFSVSFQFQYICCQRKHCFTFLKTCYVANAQEGHWCKQSSNLLSFSGRDEEMSTYLRSVLVSQKKEQRESSRLHALGKEPEFFPLPWVSSSLACTDQYSARDSRENISRALFLCSSLHLVEILTCKIMQYLSLSGLFHLA